MIINVNGQLITVADRNLLVSGSVNIYGAVVNFSPEWEGFEKVIVWKRVGAAITEPIIRPIVNGVGSIPNEIVSDPGRIRVGVAGVTATKRMPTVWSEVFEVVPGAYPGAFIPEPDPDIWQQFAGVLEEIRREAAETISTAGEVMQTATSAAQASSDKAAEASQSASNAAVSAQSAAESASVASASKAAASQSASEAESAKTAAESAKSAAASAKDDAFASMREADAAATRAEQSATNAANTLASVNAQANARKAEINELASAQKTQITDLTESKKGEIQSKGDEVLASIPEDYTEVLSDIGALKQDKADKSEVELLRKKNAEQDYEIEVLKAVTKGIEWIEHEDASEAMVKTVPAGAEGVQIDSIGAKSVVWNQFAENNPFTSRNGVTTATEGAYSVIDGICNGNLSASGWFVRSSALGDVNLLLGHVVFMKLDIISGSFDGTVRFGSHNFAGTVGAGVIGMLTDASLSGAANYFTSFYAVNGSIFNNLKVLPIVVDLTKMFGSGNEPSSVNDPRIAWIEKYAELHPEYNSGEILDGVIDSVVSSGKNLVNVSRFTNVTTDTRTFANIQLQYLKNEVVLGTIVVKNSAGSGAWRKNFSVPVEYDRLRLTHNGSAKDIVISSNIGNFEIGKQYMFSCNVIGDNPTVIGGLVVDEIMVEEGSVATSYTPYREPQISDLTALVSKYFPDGMHGSNGVFDHFDFETKKAVRVFDAVDLGSINYSYDDSSNWKTFESNGFDPKRHPSGALIGALCDNGYTQMDHIYAGDGKDFVMSVGSTYHSKVLLIRDSRYTSASNFKAAMSGVRLIFEMRTPIETDLDPADVPMLQMLVEEGGTLAFNNEAKLDIPSVVTYAVRTGGVA